MRRIFPKESAMDTRLSLASILSSLETQVAHHREQESLHAEREAFHRGRRAEHAAELEQLVGHLETFQASAAGAVELAARLKAPLDRRQVSVALRWLVADGRIVQQEKGRPHWESKYVRRGVG
jgi:hypothetical protein